MAQFTAKRMGGTHPLPAWWHRAELLVPRCCWGPGIKAATQNQEPTEACPELLCCPLISQGRGLGKHTGSSKAPVCSQTQPRGCHEADGAQMYSWAAGQSFKPAPTVGRKHWAQLWARLLPSSQWAPHGACPSQDMINFIVIHSVEILHVLLVKISQFFCFVFCNCKKILVLLQLCRFLLKWLFLSTD